VFLVINAMTPEGKPFKGNDFTSILMAAISGMERWVFSSL